MKRLIAILGAALAVVVMTARTETGSGKDLFERRCSGRHSLDHDKEGPRLGASTAERRDRLRRSITRTAWQNPHKAWDANSLEKWLAGPDKFVPDADMGIPT